MKKLTCILLWITILILGRVEDLCAQVSLDTTICPSQFPFTWNGVTFYHDSVAVTQGGTMQMTVQHHPTPIHSLNMAEEICAGDTLPVSIGVSPQSVLMLIENSATISESQKIFLPDGMYCSPYGTYYRSIANFNQFIPGATMTNVNDILYVRLKIEHSALEDLKISIVCPNGSRSKLIADYNSGTESWDNIPNNYFRTCLGLANRLTDVVSCDSSLNPIGEPWNYIWSNNTNHNYQYAAGTYGYCYESVNLQSYVNPYWDFNSSYQPYYDSYTTHKSVKPSDPVSMTQIYHPYQSFSNLIGCPLNGQWYIEVQDMLSEDNGYLTEWELAMAPSLLQTIVPTVVSKQLIGPWITALTDSTFIITPPATLTSDTTVDYRFVLQTDIGCQYDTTVSLTVHPNYAVERDTSVCDSDFPITWEGITFNAADTQTLRLQTTHGCDSVVSLHLTIGHSATADTTAEACGSFSWYEHRNILNSCDHLTHVFHKDDGCDSIVTLHLTIFPLPQACFNYYTLGGNYEIGTMLHFEECSPNMTNYHWEMGNSVAFEEPAFDYAYMSAGSYRVTLRVTDENGCTAEQHRVVVIKNPELQIFLPNSFTPNQDGLNDVFKPTGLHITDDQYLFVIYDRWGHIVFQTADPEEGWDGTYKDQKVPNNSVMSWTLRCASDDGMVRKKGMVVVMY